MCILGKWHILKRFVFENVRYCVYIYLFKSKYNSYQCVMALQCLIILPYKRNIWRTLYLANEDKNRIGEILNWRSTLQQSISAYIANGKL